MRRSSSMGLSYSHDLHPSTASDPADSIPLHIDRMAGFYMALLRPCGYRPLPIEDYKEDVVRLRVGRNLLAVLQADEDRVEARGFYDILFDVAIGRELRHIMEIDMLHPYSSLSTNSASRSPISQAIPCTLGISIHPILSNGSPTIKAGRRGWSDPDVRFCKLKALGIDGLTSYTALRVI